MKKLVYLLIGGSFLYVSCGGGQQPAAQQESAATAAITPEDQELLKQAQSLFAALPEKAEDAEHAVNPDKVALGKVLYYDTRLSKAGKNSCNSCHNLATFGVDNEVTSEGDAGKRGSRNSPTTLNAALHFTQFWDGRAKNVEEQAGMPILNPVEMNIPSKEFLEKKLKDIAEYKELFAKAYPGSANAITYANIQDAIGNFERTLLTPSKFDQYLKGNINAMSADERAGLHEFISSGCTTCHAGVALGGTMFQKFGLVSDYRPLTGSKGNDNGRKDITKDDFDKDMFKVPSMRNVTKTQPFFHDGSVADLGQAVKIMAKVELNKELTDAQVSSIIAFLTALEGDLPADVKTAPAVLASAK